MATSWLPKPCLNLEIRSGERGDPTGETTIRFKPALRQENPDWVLTYCDTNSILTAAIAAVKIELVTTVDTGWNSPHPDLQHPYRWAGYRGSMVTHETSPVPEMRLR